jgi:hypothetical protein
MLQGNMTRRSAKTNAVTTHARQQQHQQQQVQAQQQDPVLEQQDTAWPAVGTHIKLRLDDAGLQDGGKKWDGVVYVSDLRTRILGMLHSEQPQHSCETSTFKS